MCIRPSRPPPRRTEPHGHLPKPRRRHWRHASPPAARRTAPSPHRAGGRAIAELSGLVLLPRGRDEPVQPSRQCGPAIARQGSRGEPPGRHFFRGWSCHRWKSRSSTLVVKSSSSLSTAGRRKIDDALRILAARRHRRRWTHHPAEASTCACPPRAEQCPTA